MKILLKVLNYTVTLILVLIIGTSLFLTLSARRSPDRIPTLAGRKILNVLSGSMEPGISAGDVIIIRPLGPAEELKEGDVVTFKANEKGASRQVLITHRIIGIVYVNEKPSAYVTKGDANDSKDLYPVSRDQVVGVYAGRIPYFGFVANFLKTPLGIILLLVIPGLLAIAGEVRKIYQILTEEEQRKAAAAEVQQEKQQAQ
ncbi:MAG: signal peptidase I [Bacillota bacterium]